MSKDYLSYWKPETASDHIKQDHAILEHSASNQYGRVQTGDTIWIVTVRDGDLYLLGNILVSKVVTHEEASKIFNAEDIWKARYHILCERDSAQPIRNILISHLSEHLRFKSTSGKNRLNMLNGKVNPQQFQTMRILEPASTELLHKIIRNVHTSKKQKPLSSPPNAKHLTESKPTSAIKPKPDKILSTLKKLQTAARNNYNSLIKREYSDVDRSEIDLNGLCYVLAECMYHLFPTLIPHRIGWADGSSHWFLRYPDGRILETIAENGECSDPDELEDARRRRFLTSRPSKRALQLYKFAGIQNPAHKQ